jgi:hypothetical protein
MPFDRRNDRSAGRRVLPRLVLGAGLAAVLLCANTAAVRAGGDDPDNESAYSKIMRALGLKDPRTLDYGIDYNERSPLVVPPTRDLPPPQSAAPPPVADWPKDPDVARRNQAKKEDKVVPHPDYVIDSSRALRPDELNDVPGARTGDPGRAKEPDDVGVADTGKKNIWDFNIFKKEEYATFTGEPARQSLTDPPPGYLTPSPDQPYGISPEQKAYKVPTLADRVEPTR